MNLNPLSWPLTAKVIALIIVAAGTGAAAALVVNGSRGSGAASATYSSCAARVRETQPGSSQASADKICAGLADATGVSSPSADISPTGNGSPAASPTPDPSVGSRFR